MLEGHPFVSFLPIADAARAKAFYCDLLGLPLRQEDQFAVVVDAGGAQLRLAVVQQVPDPVGTNAGWLVSDLNATVSELTDAGVVFERFTGMEQDVNGVWRSPGGSAVAWFRDPDGNRLSLSQATSTPPSSRSAE